MNDRDYLLEIARKREADAQKEGLTKAQRERLLTIAREHRELAEQIERAA